MPEIVEAFAALDGRGQPGPVTDGGIGERLFQVMDEFKPAGPIFPGGTIHAPKPMSAEREFIEAILQRLIAKASVRIVQGNHDRAFTRDLPGLHGDRLHLELPEAGHYLIGHLHPANGLRNRRLPVFLVSPPATILPARTISASQSDL